MMSARPPKDGIKDRDDSLCLWPINAGSQLRRNSAAALPPNKSSFGHLRRGGSRDTETVTIPTSKKNLPKIIAISELYRGLKFKTAIQSIWAFNKIQGLTKLDRTIR